MPTLREPITKGEKRFLGSTMLLLTVFLTLFLWVDRKNEMPVAEIPSWESNLLDAMNLDQNSHGRDFCQDCGPPCHFPCRRFRTIFQDCIDISRGD